MAVNNPLYRRVHESLLTLAMSAGVLAAPISAQNNELIVLKTEPVTSAADYVSGSFCEKEAVVSVLSVPGTDEGLEYFDHKSDEGLPSTSASLEDRLDKHEPLNNTLPNTEVVTSSDEHQLENSPSSYNKENDISILQISNPRSSKIDLFRGFNTIQIPTGGESLRILLITGNPDDIDFDYNKAFNSDYFYNMVYGTEYFYLGLLMELAGYHSVNMHFIRKANEFFDVIPEASQELGGPLDVLIYAFHGSLNSFAIDTRTSAKKRMKGLEQYAKIEELFGAEVSQLYHSYDGIDFRQGYEAVRYYDILQKAPLFKEYFSNNAFIIGVACSQIKDNALFSVGGSFSLALGMPFFGLDDKSNLTITRSEKNDYLYLHNFDNDDASIQEVSLPYIPRFW